MNEQDEPYEDSSDYMEYPQQEQSARLPQGTSENPTESDFQRTLRQAISGSQFHDSYLPSGIPIRRRGSALHISYDQSLEMLWGER